MVCLIHTGQGEKEGGKELERGERNGEGKEGEGEKGKRKGIDFTWRTSQGQFWIECSIFLHKSLRITIVERRNCNSEKTIHHLPQI